MKKSLGLTLTLTLGAVALTACGSRPTTKAPVEDRGAMRSTTRAASVSSPSPAPASELAKPLRGQENAGKAGHYTVQRGDTLIRIALDNGQNWKDIARWNNLENPNLIEVGEVLRVVPPAGDGVVAKPITPGGASGAPLAPQGRTASANAPATGTPNGTASAPPNATASPQPPTTGATNSATNNAAPTSEEEVGWIWPARGTTLAGFDEAKNKGIDITGKAGDPVVAAADGRVVYAGSGLRGYGNLVILKHNNTYLTAYAHNQALLVKEDQTVKQGQKIAEMGSSDADRVKLHFEIRRQGKPVDPAKYLPAR